MKPPFFIIMIRTVDMTRNTLLRMLSHTVDTAGDHPPASFLVLRFPQTLITTLSKSKTMSKAITERLADSKSTKRQIEDNRERYRPVAVRGSLLYFTVAELCRVDVMYQYSLDYFQVSPAVQAATENVHYITAVSWIKRGSRALQG